MIAAIFTIYVSFAESEEERIVREFAFLLDANEAYANTVLCGNLLNLLGIQGGKVLVTSPFDLIFIHFGASECAGGTEEEDRASGTEYVNSLVGHNAFDSTWIRNQFQAPSFPQAILCEGSSREKASCITSHASCPWQEAVTLRDIHMAELFSFDDFKERVWNLVIPADGMLHEIAFKLSKAPNLSF
ncbi:hypothetical protein MLD38_014681 [Melastoma candidum]|uniref:Uncharacterized protein n=1 Tax=Melastoma candidum TaxID=119954 RepID=A0ACB9REW3_9MYRT|nr:hypothetical protein MLD38_014681 [Melastoma candidum]